MSAGAHIDIATVLAVLSPDAAFTVQEVAGRVAESTGEDAWAIRGTIRNRLYNLEQMGAVICDDERPLRYMIPDPSIHEVPS